MAGAIRVLTEPVAVEDQKEEELLLDNVYTNPKFKPDTSKCNGRNDVMFSEGGKTVEAAV